MRLILAILILLSTGCKAEAANIFEYSCTTSDPWILISEDTPETGTGWTQEDANSDWVFCYDQDPSDDWFRPGSGGSSTHRLYTADATYPSADYGIQLEGVDFDNGDDSQHLILRFQDMDNYYAVEFSDASPNGCHIFKNTTAGGIEDIASAESCFAADGSIVKFEIQGSDLKFYDDGEVKVSGSDSDITATGKAGIGYGNLRVSTDDLGTQTFDDVVVYTVGATAPESTLAQ